MHEIHIHQRCLGLCKTSMMKLFSWELHRSCLIKFFKQKLSLKMFLKIGVSPAALLRRDSDIGIFCQIFWKFSEHLFWRTSERLLLFVSACVNVSFIRRGVLISYSGHAFHARNRLRRDRLTTSSEMSPSKCCL